MLREQRKSRKGGGCFICNNPEICKELDVLIAVLKKEKMNVGYYASDLRRSLNEILPGVDIRRTRLADHLNDCRPGWNV